MSEAIPSDLSEVLDRHHLRTDFSPEVEREVAAIRADPGIDDPALEDWTGLDFVTIDNPDSMDLDQALYIARDGEGFRVCYALADAAHFVPADSALFAEALKRGASFYLPGLCVPMLPEALSEDLVSLNPQVDRRALIFDMRLAPDGASRSTRIARGRIRSRAKLSYEGVQAYYDQGQGHPLADQDYTPVLDLLAEVGRLKLAEARRRDAVRFNRADVEVERGRDGALVIVARARLDSSLYNEQISLLCNSEGARLLASQRGDSEAAQAVYRVHDAPPPQSLKRLERVLEHLARVHRLDRDVWCWHRGAESLADLLERLPVDGPQAPLRDAVERQVLLTNQRSVYSAEPGLHYALGVTPYSRFSSPMREVVGVFTHKEALEQFSLVPAAKSPTADEELRELVIQAANRSKQLQGRLNKDVIKLAVDALFEHDLHQPMTERPARPATVMGLSAHRLYARLDDPPVDLKVYLDDLQARLGVELALDDSEVELVARGASRPRFAIGDRINLRVADYDRNRHRWHLVPA